MCACGGTAVALVDKHDIEKINSFHTTCFGEIVFTCFFVGVCVCVCLSSLVSVEFSSVSYRLVNKLCCMLKFVFARLFTPRLSNNRVQAFLTESHVCSIILGLCLVFFVRIPFGIIPSVIRQTASYPLALFSISLSLSVCVCVCVCGFSPY